MGADEFLKVILQTESVRRAVLPREVHLRCFVVPMPILFYALLEQCSGAA